MSQAQATFDEAAVLREVLGIIGLIESSPATGGRSGTADAGAEAAPHPKKPVVTQPNLQERIDHLRLLIMYLLLDLEAAKREIAYMRKMLEEQQE